VLKVSELGKREKVIEYQEKWNAVKEREIGDMDKEWQLFKSAMVGGAEEVWGVRRCGGGVRKGSEWWCEEVSAAIAEKRCAYEVVTEER